MPRFLLTLGLLFVVSIRAHANSVAVVISPDRHAAVHVHYSVSGPAEFVFLASACGRVENIESTGGRRLDTSDSGPWVHVSVPATNSVDLTYEVVPLVPEPRSCAVPILMPQRAVDSVAVTVTDLGSKLSRISVPQLLAHPNLNTWSATFPAVPSHLELEWETGNTPPALTAGPSGRFFWNFWGLVGVLVTWIIAYLLWARRRTS